MAEGSQQDPNQITLIHLEPAVYDHFPADRDDRLMLEIVIAALTYREVLIKDTDLIINQRFIKVLLTPPNFDIFAELIRLGLVTILIRPFDHDWAGTGLDPALYPLTVRACNIRTRGERVWQPEYAEKRYLISGEFRNRI